MAYSTKRRNVQRHMHFLRYLYYLCVNSGMVKRKTNKNKLLGINLTGEKCIWIIMLIIITYCIFSGELFSYNYYSRIIDDEFDLSIDCQPIDGKYFIENEKINCSISISPNITGFEDNDITVLINTQSLGNPVNDSLWNCEVTFEEIKNSEKQTKHCRSALSIPSNSNTDRHRFYVRRYTYLNQISGDWFTGYELPPIARPSDNYMSFDWFDVMTEREARSHELSVMSLLVAFSLGVGGFLFQFRKFLREQDTT
jgi:hypothetical protein